MDIRNLSHPRLLLGIAIILAVPILLQAAVHTLSADQQSVGTAEVDRDTNITFISIQGSKTGEGAGVYAINTETKETVWSHTSYHRKYFDVDPLNESTILFTVMTSKWPWKGGTDGYPWYAIVYNWRTDTVTQKFPVPPGTHDADYLGDGKYIIGDMTLHQRQHEAYMEVAKERGWISEDREETWHRLYIYDTNTDEITWEYNFSDHYPDTAGDGIGNHQDYTHVNDVDSVLNGTAFLTSPREFDSVILINRTTKETIWELGEEDNYDILYEQHNPVLLDSNPPTVLVADSENDRVVEYEMKDGEWNQTWVYSRNLDWSRDADRLPNGNTLITDTANGRVIEVTPDGGIVWQYNTNFGPYEAERLKYGDEPSGPRVSTLNGTTKRGSEQLFIVSLANEYFFLAQWILPGWITHITFWLLHIEALLLIGSGVIMIRSRIGI